MKVRFYTGNYKPRQLAANRDKADFYVEQHFNAVANRSANYTHAKVATNASSKSYAIAKTYAEKCAEVFGIKKGFGDGVDKGGRGNTNLVHTKMPAILLEPLFVSNPAQAAIVKSKRGQKQLAQVLVDTIREHFPEGSLIAFSIGHKGKTGRWSRDRGASVYGGGTEAQYAEIVLKIAEKMLKEKSQDAPCEQDNTEVYYEVQKGNTLFGIAKKFGVSVDWIKEKNNLTENKIEIGQKLLIRD